MGRTEGPGRSRTEGPDVAVVIATHNRPALVRRAIESVLGQEHPGAIRIALVFDRSAPDESLARADPRRGVLVTANDRTPGLAGARNTGILATESELVAFCDDDDIWLPGKLAAQLERLARVPEAQLVTTATRVDYGNERSSVRLAGKDRVTLRDLTRSRVQAMHPSSFLFRRAAMLGDGGFGLVDETLPRSMAEEWDLLLRVARRAPIEHVDEPLVAALWGANSYFMDAWNDRNEAHRWLLDHHPEFAEDPASLGFMLGKLAFGHAAVGQRRESLRYARQALRANWREPRTPIALLVAAGVSPKWVTTQLNRRGHGI